MKENVINKLDMGYNERRQTKRTERQRLDNLGSMKCEANPKNEPHWREPLLNLDDIIKLVSMFFLIQFIFTFFWNSRRGGQIPNRNKTTPKTNVYVPKPILLKLE